jgi:hypothetical protein
MRHGIHSPLQIDIQNMFLWYLKFFELMMVYESNKKHLMVNVFLFLSLKAVRGFPFREYDKNTKKLYMPGSTKVLKRPLERLSGQNIYVTSWGFHLRSPKRYLPYFLLCQLKLYNWGARTTQYLRNPLSCSSQC